MSTIIDIASLYSRAFNYIAPPFPAGGVPTVESVVNRLIPTRIEGINAESDAIRMPMSIRIPGEEAWFTLPNEPIVSIRSRKDFKTTTITRIREEDSKQVVSSSSVKEEMNIGDFQIDIKGLAINLDDFDEYPEEIMQEMKRYYNYRGALEVNHQKLRVEGISQLYIISKDVPDNNPFGIYIQPYSFTAISDEPFSLELAPIVRQQSVIRNN